MVNDIDILHAEADQAIESLRATRTRQRLLNIIMMLAIGALFILVLDLTFYSEPSLVSMEETLLRVCQEADYRSLSPADRMSCVEVINAGR